MRTLVRWAFLSGVVTVVQALIQGVNALSGLLLVRYLPKDDYAWFTIAASLMATLNLLADGGTSTGLTTIGGRLCDQPGPLARLLRDGLGVSGKLCFVGLLLAAPLFGLLLAKVSAPPLVITGVLLLAAASAWPSVATVILNVANRLCKRVYVVQAGEVACAVTRLSLTGLALAVGWASVLPMLATAVISTWVQALVIRLKTISFLRHPSGDTHRPQIARFVRSLYANHIFFCVQAQISTWIIGCLAGASEVADLGALARLGALFAAITAPVHYLAVPAIARIQELHTLRRRFGLVFAAVFSVSVGLVMLAWWMPAPFLWVLGANYSHLEGELPLALSAQGLISSASLAWALVLVRGWVVSRAWMTIFLTILGFILGAWLFPLHTVGGMLCFGLVSVVPTLLFCLGGIIYNLSGHSLEASSRQT